MVSGSEDATAATGFVAHVLRSRLFVFLASLLIMSSSGGAYIFGAYSKSIKSSLRYDQKTLNTLSLYKNLGASLGVVPGLIISNDVAAPWVLLLAGAGLNLAGYLMVYLAVSGSGHTAAGHPPVWALCLYVTLGATSQSFTSTAAFDTSVRNLGGNEDDRGAVVGLLLGFAGLSGAIFMQLLRLLDDGGAGGDGGDSSGADLLLLVACIPSAISLLFTPTLRRVVAIQPAPVASAGERKALYSFLYASILLAVYLAVVSIVELQREVTGFLAELASYATATVLVGLLIVWPLVVVAKQESSSYRHQPQVPPLTPSSSEKAAQPAPVSDEESLSVSVDNALGDGSNHILQPVAKHLFSVDMLLLLVTTICGIGGTLTAIDNTRQIGESLGYPPRTISVLVSLVSVANYAGRVAAGLGSDYAVRHYGLPRPLALTATLLLACAGHELIALRVHNGLYAASLVVGFCVGAQWTVLFSVISEVFPLEHFSLLYNLATLASPIGSYVLNVQVTGRMYDGEARHQHHLTSSMCIGGQCFKASFEIIAGVTLLGAAVSLVLACRKKAFYATKKRSHTAATK